MKKNIAIIILVLTVFIFLGQEYIYENRLMLLEDKTEGLEDEILTFSSSNNEILYELEVSEEKHSILENDKQELIELIEEKAHENEMLANNIEELEDDLSEMKYNLIKDNLPDYWHNIWDDIYKSEGVLTDIQIEEINFLLQPVFLSNEWTQVNPLSCFFTSYYKDTRDIDLDEFLRYCPYGEVPEELLEFEDLKLHENWPFGDVDTNFDFPVPTHRYKREVVQNIFTSYAGISLEELNGVGFDYLIYLESTDAYYNFTSDFGPGVFVCIGGTVVDGVIRLNGASRSVLTIIKVDGKYVIKSFLEQ